MGRLGYQSGCLAEDVGAASVGWLAGATAGDMADWLSFLASEGLGISAVRIARAAVSAAHREGASLQVLAGGEGLADPAQDWLVSATIGGIARRSDPPSQAPGLRVHGFARILAVVELEATPATPRGRRAMRDGLLRRGEAAGGTVAITHNGHSIYPFPDSRPGSGGPLLPPPLKKSPRVLKRLLPDTKSLSRPGVRGGPNGFASC